MVPVRELTVSLQHPNFMGLMGPTNCLLREHLLENTILALAADTTSLQQESIEQHILPWVLWDGSLAGIWKFVGRPQWAQMKTQKSPESPKWWV